MAMKPLEEHKFFPVIAWTLVFGFAFFVYNLTLQVQSNTQELREIRSERHQLPPIGEDIDV